MPESKKFIKRLVERLDRVDRRELEDYLLVLDDRRGLLANIFNSMQEGLLALDTEGKVILVNNSARRILNLAPGDQGTDMTEIITAPPVLEIARQGLSVPGQSLVRDIFIPEAGSRWVRLSRTPLVDAKGNFRGLMLVASDITRRQRKEREATLAEKVDFLTYLAAAVAHELGNPISSLSLHLQLMNRQIEKVRGETGKKLSHSADILSEEMARLDGIVRQFLQVLRPGSLSLREQDPAELFEEIIELLAPELEQKDIIISLVSPPKPVRVRFDRDMIKQALINLIRNAMQASTGGGGIRVSWDTDGAYLKIKVSDQGKGIAPDDVPRVMDPFFTTREGGSGLGFLVVYRIVRQHGGMVEIASEPEEGTIVTVWLPRRPEDLKQLPGGSEIED